MTPGARGPLSHLYARQHDWMQMQMQQHAHTSHDDGTSTGSPASSRRGSLQSVQSVTARRASASASVGTTWGLGGLQDVLEEALAEESSRSDSGPGTGRRPSITPIQTAPSGKDDSSREFDTASPFIDLFHGWPQVACLPASSTSTPIDSLAARSDSSSSTGSSIPPSAASDITSPRSVSTRLTTPSTSATSIHSRLASDSLLTKGGTSSSIPRQSTPISSRAASVSTSNSARGTPYKRTSLPLPGSRRSSLSSSAGPNNGAGRSHSMSTGAFGTSLPASGSAMHAAAGGGGGGSGSIRSGSSSSSAGEGDGSSRGPSGSGGAGGSGSGFVKSDPGGGVGSGGGSGPIRPDGSKRKESKKKAAKACSHCQRAHLTCDDSRPCQRCVKKGTADTCVDGQRKKAKYLMDEEEKARLRDVSKEPQRTNSSELPPRPSSSFAQQSAYPASSAPMLPSLSAPPVQAPPIVQPRTSVPDIAGGLSTQSFAPAPEPQGMILSPAPAYPLAEPARDGFPMGTDFLQDTDPIFDLNFDPAYQFDSHAANQEYTMLSSIFADASGNISTPTNGGGGGLSQPLFQLDPAWPDENGGMSLGGQQGTGNAQSDSFLHQDSAMSGVSSGQQEQDRQSVLPQNPFADIAKRSAAALGMDSMFPQEMSTMTPTQVYNDVNKPYPYTEGYHFLMRYLTQNFDQGDILKVVKSLAAFRPSLIALQMPLSVEDEVFLEKSFQRTLIELEKLISYSGTPTAVWRRTGEICLAGDEFCRLTEFHRSDLLGKKTFIYELFEKQSVIDYFEKFSQYAFENTTQNFFWQCILVTASGKQVPCSCSFTIRRDVFDLPSVVIGQLLPMNA